MSETHWKSAAGSTAIVYGTGSWECDFDWFEEGVEQGALQDIRIEDGECWMHVSDGDECRQIQMLPSPLPQGRKE